MRLNQGKLKLKTAREHRYRDIAMGSVAVRMMVVEGSMVLEEVGQPRSFMAFFRPVLGLRSVIDSCYTQDYLRAEPYAPELARQLEEAGWALSYHETTTELLIWDDDMSVISLNEIHTFSPGSEFEVVLLPWPYDEARDKAQFEPVIARLKARLEEKAKAEAAPEL